MTDETKQAILADFFSWSGGFVPDAFDHKERETYLFAALPTDFGVGTDPEIRKLLGLPPITPDGTLIVSCTVEVSFPATAYIGDDAGELTRKAIYDGLSKLKENVDFQVQDISFEYQKGDDDAETQEEPS